MKLTISARWFGNLNRAHQHLPQLLGFVQWDHVPNEHNSLLTLRFPIYREHSRWELWTFQQATINYQIFSITASFFGRRPSCSCLVKLWHNLGDCMYILIIIKMKILVLVEWSYRSSQSCWVLNIEWLTYFEHTVQSRLKTGLIPVVHYSFIVIDNCCIYQVTIRSYPQPAKVFSIKPPKACCKYFTPWGHHVEVNPNTSRSWEMGTFNMLQS